MNYFKGKKAKKFIAVILFLFLFTMIATPDQLLACSCSKALLRCFVDAGIAAAMGAVAGLFSGHVAGSLLGAGVAGGSYSIMCIAGYDFCKRYYEDI
jgi:hypothetical protein